MIRQWMPLLVKVFFVRFGSISTLPMYHSRESAGPFRRLPNCQRGGGQGSAFRDRPSFLGKSIGFGQEPLVRV